MFGRLLFGAKVITVLALCFLFPNSYAQAQAEYLTEVPPKRMALVVANSDYDTQTKLPGAAADGDTMSALLKDAGFEVKNARNVSRAEFLSLHLLPFVETVGEDDFAVFYFSGHGFNYGGENYLVPLNFPKTVPDNLIFSNSISVTSVQSLINSKRPAFTLMLLDACRNVAEFIVPSGKDTKTIEKGLGEMRAAFDNFVIGFSSGPGTLSFGSSEAGKLSYYTAALAKFLPEVDMSLDAVRKEVDFHVKFETENSQKPYFSISSATEVYLKQSDRMLSQEKELWLAALASQEAKPVARFVARYSVSRFVRAARKWLTDHEKKTKVARAGGFTRISPFAPELAWEAAVRVAETGAKPPPILLRRMEGPIAFAREAVGTDAMINDITYSDVAVNWFDQTLATASPTSVFGKHAEVVLTGPVGARMRPSSVGKLVALSTGTRLTVQGIEADRGGVSWMRLVAANQEQPLFLNIADNTKVATTNLGEPLAEVDVGGVPRALAGISDAGTAIDALNKLRSAGRSILWVSVTTPASAEESKRDLLGLRAEHLINALRSEGISRRQISTVENYVGHQGDNIKVRFLGN